MTADVSSDVRHTVDLWNTGYNQVQIAKIMHLSRQTIRRYLDKAEEAGLIPSDGQELEPWRMRETAALWNQGKTQAEIGEAEGITRQAARKRLVKAGQAGLLSRPLPGSDYRKNIAKYNPANRPQPDAVVPCEAA